MLWRLFYQPHIAVDTAHKGEVGRDGCDGIILIRHFDLKRITTIVQIGCEVKGKGRITADVLTNGMSVNQHFSMFESSIYLQPRLKGASLPHQLPFISKRALLVVLHRIGIDIPGMWQVNGCSLECPTIVKGLYRCSRYRRT